MGLVPRNCTDCKHMVNNELSARHRCSLVKDVVEGRRYMPCRYVRMDGYSKDVELCGFRGAWFQPKEVKNV
jgi:hypothetical protein